VGAQKGDSLVECEGGHVTDAIEFPVDFIYYLFTDVSMALSVEG